MDIQNRNNQLTKNERNLYLLGAIIFIVLVIMTIIFGNLFSPLRLLQVRLSIVGTGLIYNLAVYLYYQRLFKKNHQNIEVKQNEIIICFNGKVLSEK